VKVTRDECRLTTIAGLINETGFQMSGLLESEDKVSVFRFQDHSALLSH
jgi:hypothetical protein